MPGISESTGPSSRRSEERNDRRSAGAAASSGKLPDFPPAVAQIGAATTQATGEAARDPGSPVGKDIDGAANMITAAICKLTHGQPRNVCASPGVAAAARSL
jgi:hypothetical protein